MRAGELRDVDHLRARQFVLEFGNAPLVQGLRFLGGVIFRVLGQIAMRARFGDRLDDARTLDLLAPLQLLFEGDMAARRHGELVHAHSLSRLNLKNASPSSATLLTL